MGDRNGVERCRQVKVVWSVWDKDRLVAKGSTERVEGKARDEIGSDRDEARGGRTGPLASAFGLTPASPQSGTALR